MRIILIALLVLCLAAPVMAAGSPSDKPKKADMAKLKSDLKALGMTDTHLASTELKDVSKDSTKTRKELANELKAVMKAFPKKK